MPTEEEERKAKADRAKKLLAKSKKNRAAASSTSHAVSAATTPASPALTDGDLGTTSTRTSISVEDRPEVGPPPKGGRRKKLEEVEVREDVQDAGGEDLKVNGNGDAGGAERKAAEDVKGDATDISSVPVVTMTADQSTSAAPSTSDPELHQTISTLTTERDDLLSKVSSLETSATDLRANQKQLEDTQAIVARLESEKAGLETRVSDLLGEAEGAKSLREELESARVARTDAEARAKEAEEKLSRVKSDARAKTADLEKGLERAREREGGLEVEIGRLRQLNTELTSSSSATSTEVESLRKELGLTKEESEGLRTDHSTLQTKYEELSSSHITLQSAHTATTADLERLRSEHTSRSSQLDTAQSALTFTQAELERSNTSLSAERKRADTAEKKRSALQTEKVLQLSEVRGKVTSVMEEKADLVGELDSVKAQRSSLDGQAVKKLEEELQASTNRIQALTRQVADLQSALQNNREYSGSPSNVFTDTPPFSVTRTVDAILPANVRHKRQVSLTALKARMGSSYTKSAGNMESLAEDPGGSGTKQHQFGDEITFCCPCCQGDLIVV